MPRSWGNEPRSYLHCVETRSWGGGIMGELGLGDHVNPLDQDPMQSLRPIRRISLGPYHNGPSPKFRIVAEGMVS